jgi:hypothetical protein
LVGEYHCLFTLEADVINQREVSGDYVITLRYSFAGYNRGISPSDESHSLYIYRSIIIVEKRLRIRFVLKGLSSPMILLVTTERFINPSYPALQVTVAFVHHDAVSLALIANDVKFAQYTASLQPFDIIHACLHEPFYIDCGWVVIVITKNGLVSVTTASRWMCETC